MNSLDWISKTEFVWGEGATEGIEFKNIDYIELFEPINNGL